MRSASSVEQAIIKEYFAKGQRYFHGKGAKKDFDLALKYFQMAADKGLVSAAYNASLILMDECSKLSMSVTDQRKNLIKYLTQAAEQTQHPEQSAHAHYRLFTCYTCGIEGISQDLKLGYHHLKIAANFGIKCAQLDLAEVFLKKQTKIISAKECFDILKGVESSPKSAFKLLSENEKDYVKIYAKACELLGMCFQKGVSIPASNEKALEYYQLAIDNGNIEAVKCLYELYAASGTPYDKTAIEYYNKAAKLGSGDAYYYLANSYLKKDSETKDKADNKAIGLQCLLKAVASNNLDENFKTEALFLIAYAFAEGEGVKQDRKTAFEYAVKAADRGNLEAQINVARQLSSGEFVPRNTKKAIEYLKLAADKGAHIAKYYLAMILYQRKENLKDKTRAFALMDELVSNAEFKKRKGFWVSSLVHLGIFYFTGYGVEPNPEKAVAIFNQVLQEDIPYSMSSNRAYYYLAQCYLEGHGVIADPDRAFRLLKLAEPDCKEDVYFLLGECYRNALGVSRDLTQARRYFESAAAKNTEAKIRLIAFYLLGMGGEQNVEKAFALLRESNTRDKVIQNALGVCYLYGWGVPQDAYKARELFQQSNEQGDDFAGNNLGWCYLLGFNAPQDFEAAVECFRAGVQKRNIYSMINLAWCYLNGLGVECDPIRAQALFAMADEGRLDRGIRFNFAFAFCEYFKEGTRILQEIMASGSLQRYNLGLCYLNGWGVEKDLKQAFELFSKAESENINAKRQLANCYLNGLGVEKNCDKGFKILSELHEINPKDIQTYTLRTEHLYNNGETYEVSCSQLIDDLESFLEKHKQEQNELDCADAYNLLAVMYERLATDTEDPEHKRQSMKAYHAAAALGHVDANFQLGYMYETDTLGAGKNIIRSAQYYAIAAEQGHPTALYCLGLIYHKGSCTREDPSRALTYFKHAAALNNRDALFHVATCFAHGLDGTAVDLVKAQNYYKRAAELGYPDVAKALESLNERRIVLYCASQPKSAIDASENTDVVATSADVVPPATVLLSYQALSLDGLGCSGAGQDIIPEKLERKSRSIMFSRS